MILWGEILGEKSLLFLRLRKKEWVVKDSFTREKLS